jgi:hypothetical protein
MHPGSEVILESSLYVKHAGTSARLYEKIFGFHVISDFGERGCAMRAGPQQVLLLFTKGGSRSIPSPHDGEGDFWDPDRHLLELVTPGVWSTR